MKPMTEWKSIITPPVFYYIYSAAGSYSIYWQSSIDLTIRYLMLKASANIIGKPIQMQPKKSVFLKRLNINKSPGKNFLRQ